MLRFNTIYVPSWAITTINNQVSDAQFSMWESLGAQLDDESLWRSEQVANQVYPTFVLTDPLLFEDFQELAYDLLPPFYSVVDMSGSFANIATSMSTLQEIATWITIFGTGASLLILALLITLFLRDRRAEIEIYLALGEYKSRIMTQILLEVLVTAVVGMTLAVFASGVIANAISHNMLENELIAMQAADTGDIHLNPEAVAWSLIGVPLQNMSPEQMLDAFAVEMSGATVILFYLIGLGTVFLATVIPVAFVVKLKLALGNKRKFMKTLIVLVGAVVLVGIIVLINLVGKDEQLVETADGVTLEMFNQVTYGMSLDRVIEIFGTEGNYIFTSFEVRTYGWQGNSDNAFVTLSFNRDGILMTRQQIGLE